MRVKLQGSRCCRACRKMLKEGDKLATLLRLEALDRGGNRRWLG